MQTTQLDSMQANTYIPDDGSGSLHASIPTLVGATVLAASTHALLSLLVLRMRQDATVDGYAAYISSLVGGVASCGTIASTVVLAASTRNAAADE
jgi:hypothetical protein